MEILEVDLLRFERGDAGQRRAVADGVMTSLATGFVYLAHDLPEAMLDDCYARLEEFFALPTETKSRISVPASRGQRGYTGVLVETAAGSEEADWKEMLNWGEPAPPGHPLERRFPDRYGEPVLPEEALPGISRVLMDFHRTILSLQRRFLRIVAVGLGVHESFFDAMVEHGATLTRAIHYPSMTAAPGANHVWAAEHGDINLVTALPRATAPGLQIKTEEGWIDASPSDGCAILNSGMMLEHLSNGVLPAGIHRVVAEQGSSADRVAVVQFCHPTPSTILAPLSTCIDAGRPQRYGSISAADRLDEVLWEINLSGAPEGPEGGRPSSSLRRTHDRV
jgi:isopenicillin N synthase-like dioxygenase